MRYLGILAAIVATGATESSGPKDIKAIEAGYRRLESAIKHKNQRALEAMVTNDFTWTDVKGHTMNRKEFFKMNAEEMAAPGLKFHVVEMKNDSYGFMGDECTVRNHTTVKMSMKMDGKMMTMTGTSEGVDTWRKTKSGWRPCKVVTTHESQSMGN